MGEHLDVDGVFVGDVVEHVCRLSHTKPRVAGFSKEIVSCVALFRVTCFVFRVSGFGFQDSGFGFRVSGSGFQDVGLRFRVSGFEFGVSSFELTPPVQPHRAA